MLLSFSPSPRFCSAAWSCLAAASPFCLAVRSHSSQGSHADTAGRRADTPCAVQSLHWSTPRRTCSCLSRPPFTTRPTTSLTLEHPTLPPASLSWACRPPTSPLALQVVRSRPSARTLLLPRRPGCSSRLLLANNPLAHPQAMSSPGSSTSRPRLQPSTPAS